MNTAFPSSHEKPFLSRATPLPGPSEPKPEPGERMPLLLQYWRIAMRRRWLILATVLAAVAAAFIVTMFMTPLYTATATVEIARQRSNVVNVEGLEPPSSGVDLEFYQTQYSLLEARSLAERVVRELRLAETPAFFDTFGVDPDGGLFEEEDVAARRPSAQELAERREIAADILLDHITISPIRGSALVEVNFTSPDPALSQRVTNAWTKAFIASNLDRRFEATSYARQFLEERLEQLRKRLEDSERQLVQYAGQQRIITVNSDQDGAGSATAERSLLSDDLTSLNAELNRAIADRIRAQSQLGEGQTSREALNNQAIAAMRQQRAEVASEYANLLAKFSPEYPAALALSSQLEDLDRSIAREEARFQSAQRRTYTDALQREQALRSRVEALKNGALDLRRRSIQYNIIQREADTNRELYDGLLQRYKEIGVAGGVGTNNVLIVDEADVPDSPTSPNLPLNIAIGLLLGLALSAALVFALEQVDEAIRDPDAARRVLPVPLLGAVPTLHEATPEEALKDRKSAFAEAYLSVQTSLRFTTDHGIPSSLSVSSTRAAEGKSTTCYALAQSLARTGKRVVVVDADMRSPSVHHILGITNDRGLSNFLTGEDEVDRLLVPMKALGIDAIPAGPQPPNAAELLTSSRLQLLISVLLKNYDHVLIDAPPVLGLADAPLIASQVEGVVFTVQANGPKARAVGTALARLEAANANVLGAVLTKFDERKAHYGYGYEYGYGYGTQGDAGKAA